MTPRYGVVVADPPWAFQDRLTMSDVKRGAASQYATLTVAELQRLPINLLAADPSVLALWCPAALVPDGLAVLQAWSFDYKGVFTWVKTTRSGVAAGSDAEEIPADASLAFGMGRQFRAATEHALLGTRGIPGPVPAPKSERNVILHPALPHSQKPEGLQDALDRMYPGARRLELFARRVRPGWVCVGDECPETMGVDIREWAPEEAWRLV